jgi:tRNA pseudouridine55 synthase
VLITQLDGLLVVDKPVGPTSHDVVARMRRVLRERRIGHTGTLDPLASGVLLLVIGRATRLARFLNADAKRYEATIHLGYSTDTYDALGQPTSAVYEGALPSRDRIDAALDVFRGTFLQRPPAFSAKKVEGRRSYRLARAERRTPSAQTATPPLTPVAVTVFRLDILEVKDHLIRIDTTCSSGFYVRSLAHDLGAALGVGAHLAALRRTEASGHTLAESIPLAALEETDGPTKAREALIPLAEVLTDVPRLILTAAGIRRAVSGCDLLAHDFASEAPQDASSGVPARVRLLDSAHNLVGIADRTAAGLLHPVVVLM